MQQIIFSKQIMVGRSTMDTNKRDAAGIAFSWYMLSIDNNSRLNTSLITFTYYYFILLFAGLLAKKWCLRCNVWSTFWHLRDQKWASTHEWKVFSYKNESMICVLRTLFKFKSLFLCHSLGTSGRSRQNEEKVLSTKCRERTCFYYGGYFSMLSIPVTFVC